jgi:hypothetical protein
MKYAIIVYETAEEFAEREDEAKKGTYWGAYGQYSEALRAGGVAAGGAGLLPPSAATTVRLRGGSRQVTDGPYADTKEQLGGFFLIDAPDLDAALDWAAKCPAATRGSVEVRPVMVM